MRKWYTIELESRRDIAEALNDLEQKSAYIYSVLITNPGVTIVYYYRR